MEMKYLTETIRKLFGMCKLTSYFLLPPVVLIGGVFYSIGKEAEKKGVIQRGEVIIQNIIRDGKVDATERAEVHNTIDSLCNIYNQKRDKISSSADINGDGKVDATERAEVHNTIDSVVKTYNKAVAPGNIEESSLYDIIDSVTKGYDHKK